MEAYPTPIQLVGCAVAGVLVPPKFTLNLQELQSSFDEVTDFIWCAHDFALQDLEGPHISIEGVFQGPDVCLRVLSEAANNEEEPGLILDAIESRE